MAATPVWRLSGGAANADPDAALGGAISSTAAATDIFDNVTGAESAAGDTEYRGVYVYNSGDAPLVNAVVWVLTDTPDTDTAVAIGLADEGANATMETITDENTAPIGPTFSTPTDQGSGLSLGTLAAGERYGVWIRRAVTAAAGSYTGDGFTLRVIGDN